MSKNNKLLTIDIGNTTISIALFGASSIISRFSVPTEDYNNFKRKIYKILRRYKTLSVIIGSVVPRIDKNIKRDLQRLKVRYRFVKPRDFGIMVKTKEPEKVGVDRLLNTIASYKFYKKGAIVVDCGTATTFDVVSSEGKYLGGLIAPGLGIGAEALANRCAKLFPVHLRIQKFLIGKNTKEAMLSGIILGHVAMIEGIIGRLKNKLKFKPIIIGTGGFISLVKKLTDVFDIVDQNLTLKGLRIFKEILQGGKAEFMHKF